MRIRRYSLVALGLMVACTGGESSPARRKLIDSRDTYDPRSLDPALSTDVPTGRAVGYVFDGLVRFTPDAQIVPDLAREWTVSPDGLTYTFHLRTGVKFHDGRPFMARQTLTSFSAFSIPQPKADAAGHSIRSRRERLTPMEKRKRSRVDRSERFDRGHQTHRAVRDLPEAAGDAGRFDRPRLGARRTSASILSAPDHGSSSNGSTTTICCSRGIRPIGAALRNPILSRRG